MEDIRSKINNGKLDINNQAPFFAAVIKGAIWYLNQSIKIRDKVVPHFILSTGDDIMYRELMNYKYVNSIGEECCVCDCSCMNSSDLSEATGEDFIYNTIPRSIVDVGSMSVSTDQLTQPYVRANFEVEDEGNIREFSAEVMRLPVSLEMNLKYYVDNFSDSLSLIQNIFTDISFVKNYHISYLGQDIICSMKLPDSHTVDKSVEVDFNSENRSRIVEVAITIETNLPIYNLRSAVETSSVITGVKVDLFHDRQIIDVEERDVFMKI